MVTESRAAYDRGPVHGVCKQMGEAAVLADLERAGVKFVGSEQKWLAWEWIYQQRIEREIQTGEAVRATARQTLYVAVGTGLVAFFTAIMAIAAFCSK